MKKYWKFEGMLINKKWTGPAYISTNNEGKILEVETSPPIETGLQVEKVQGFLLPGFQNTHSHSFQYAMSGLAEYQGDDFKKGNFWTWREKMYSLASKIGPDQLEVLATFLYSEMLKNGYTHVTEFHYLHHDKMGNAYYNPIEMSIRLINAAKKAKIHLTLIPIFYQQGGFKQKPLAEQKRFILKSTDQYLHFFNLIKSYAKNISNVNIAMGIHSLRAVTAEDIIQTSRNIPLKTPFHIHISEQKKEVEESLEILKKSPIEWLHDNTEVTPYFNLVHGTHANEDELELLIQSKANIVLCPSTEANLGDGLFPLEKYTSRGGRWTIGSDSHIGLSPVEELRWLEYSERLKQNIRNPLCQKSNEQSGDILYHHALEYSPFSMGATLDSKIEKNHFLSGIVINHNHPLFYRKNKEALLSTLIFASDQSHLLGTIRNGEWVVSQGRHQSGEEIFKNYSKYFPIL